MNKPVAMTLALLLCSFIFAFTVGAVDAPHYDPAAGNVCGTCHTAQLTLGSTGYNNICQNCHRPGNPAAGSKPITLADAANPFGIHSTTGISKMYQTSHRWDGSDTNPAAGAQPPVQGQMTTNGLRARTDGQLACVRCHNQHDNSNGNFLRAKNDKDQLCLDCHRSRNVQSHTQGSHPVNINYTEKYAANPGGFYARPLNLNPANPTSSIYSRISSAQGTVLCSTCHSVHFADSRSSTADGSANFANLSSGDGYLLRTDRRGIDPGARNDSSNICSSCHAGKKSHNMKGQDIQCTDCHGAHVEYDPDDPSGARGTNIYLIRRNAVSKDGRPIMKNGAMSKVFFRYTGSQKEYKNSAGTGVCQSCHIVPAPDSVIGYPPEHDSNDPRVCNTCHFHNSSNGSFSGACTTCHGYPPTTANSLVGYARPADAKTGATPDNPGAHETHATGRHMACITCHTGYAAKPMPSNTIDIGFVINNSTYKNFVGSTAGGTFNGTALNSAYSWNPGNGTTLTTGNAAISCNVYCHGATLSGGAATPPTWTKTDGSQKACGACHGVTPATAPTTGSHTRHAKDNAIACASCHGAHANNDHVNGSVEWDLRALAGNAMYRGAASGGTGAIAPSAVYGQCTNISCHSSGQAADGTSSPLTYGSPTWGGTLTCGDCHKNMKTDAAAPGSHVKHAQTAAIACATCHNGYTETSVKASTHANGMINLSFSGAAANVTYSQYSTHPLGNGYGSCANVACHSATNIPGTTPVWGTAGSCATCHDATPATGSHTKHLSLAAVSCGQCHSGAVAGSSGGASHGNGTIEVANSYSASPVAKHAVGTYTGTCSAASCHADPYSSATVTSPVWGTSAGCSACHNGIGAFGAYSAPVTGSHNKHLAASVTCGTCHVGAVAGKSGGSNHANGKVDVAGIYSSSSVTKHSPGSGYLSCTTTCHSPYAEAVKTPVWGTQSNCSSCHGTPPDTGNHPQHLSPLFVGAKCADCHSGADDGSSGNAPSGGATHLNGTIEVSSALGYGSSANIAKHAKGSGYASCSTASCHLNPYGSAPVTTPDWSVHTTYLCSACHNGSGAFTGTGGAPATGSHNKHMSLSGVSCAQCHTGATTSLYNDATHKNGFIDVSNSYTASPVPKHSNGIYTGTCSTTCHSATTAAGTTPVWNTPATCSSCHEATPTTGNHTKHLALAGVSCGQCHAGAVANTSAGTAHYDGNISVTNGYPVTPKHAAGVYTGSCSTASCHANVYGSGTVTTPVWSTTGNGCSACHSVPIGATGPATGSHAMHNFTDCSLCHTGATNSTTVPSVNHANGAIDVTNGYPANVTRHAAGSGYSSCSAASCHGSSSPVWGANTTNDTCTKCHGTGTVTVTAANRYVVAPSDPAGVGTGQVSANAKIGAHQTHLRYLNGFSNYSTVDYRCESCHGTLPTTGTHAGSGASPQGKFRNIATDWGKITTASYDATTGTCSNVYCHNPSAAGLLSDAGKNPAPRWTDATYLADGGKSQTNCEKCHLVPGSTGFSKQSAHGTMVTDAATDCSGCHGHNGETSGALGQRHLDGIRYANGNCNNCHGYPPLSAAQLSARAAGEFTGAKLENYSGGGGHHSVHLLTSVSITDGFTPCLPCHPSTQHNQGGGTVLKTNINVNDDPTDLTYRFDGKLAKIYNRAAMSCSNISCHFQPTPAWN